MADQVFTTKRLLVLRKLTRAVADLVRGQLKEHLATLAFLLRPKNIFGEFVEGAKDRIKDAEAAFKEMQTTYDTLTSVRNFNLPKQLNPPLEVSSAAPEITPHEYTHEAHAEGQTKLVTVTAPLKFVLTYSGFGPKRLKELLAAPVAGNEIQEFVLHTLLLNGVLARQPGLTKILEALHFTVSAGRVANLGPLPFAFVTAAVPSIRPPDDVIIESTEISGADTFEEVVDLDALIALRDPYKDRLLELAKPYGEVAGTEKPA